MCPSSKGQMSKAELQQKKCQLKMEEIVVLSKVTQVQLPALQAIAQCMVSRVVKD